jgi:hypothetical protein
MDLEGTDSGERGEDRTTFERQTILYGLALCEVLIVNMWYTDIGRYTASNYGIMKTVFEVNLQLFKAQGKTMLLFIVRDYIAQQTPFSALEAKLRGEMQRIWDELRKPDEYADARMEDFFDFRFEALPHYVLQRPQFDDDAASLRDRFTDAAREDSFLNTAYHGNKSVPAEGFAQYSESVWSTIRDNQDLNLPSQRELLATFRCDQAIAAMMDKFQDARFAELQAAAGAAADPELGVKVGAHLQGVVDEFDADTAKYAPAVVSRKRGELRKKLLLQCEVPLATQIEAFIVPGCTKQFQKDLAFAVGGGELCPDLYITTARLRTAALDAFRGQCSRLCAGLADEVAAAPADDSKEADAAPPASETLAERLSRRHLQQLERQLDALTEAARKAQLHVLSAAAAGDMLARLAEPVAALFKEAPADLWARVGAVFVKELAATAQQHEEVLDQLVNDDAERAVVLRELVLHAEAALREQALQQAQVCPLKMKARFDALFSRHEGSRRVWGAKDQPRVLFNAAREASLALLPLLGSFRLRAHWGAAGALVELPGKEGEEPAPAPALARQGTVGAGPAAVDEDGHPLLLTAAQTASFKEDFLVDVEGALHDAQRERERNMAQNRVPAWAVVMMLVLGYNEIVAILSNPLFLVLAVLLAVGGFVVHQLGMWGPVTSVAKGLLDQGMQQLNGALQTSPDEDAPMPKQTRSLSINPSINLDTLPSAPSSVRNMERESEVTQRRKEE